LGKPFARHWLHSNMLTIGGQKMSKSAGNFVSIEDTLAQHDPLAVRYFIVASHYRSVVDYSESTLSGATAALQRLHQTVRTLRSKMPATAKAPGQYFQEFRNRFCAAMDDDFGTPQALAVLFDLSREANTLLAQPSPDSEALLDAEQLFRNLGGDVLGLIPEQLAEQAGDRHMDDAMQILIELRKHFRESKDYQRADWVRDQLQNAGIALKDSRDGTTWEVSA
jgi:cysteinyl-tRNA synthetase